MLLLWMVFPVAYGWQLVNTKDVFLVGVHGDSNPFHHTLFQSDSAPLASHHVDEQVSGKQASEEHTFSGGTSSKGSHSGTAKATSHDKEGGRKGHSGKENVKKQYEEEWKKKGVLHSEDGHGDEHHSGIGGGRGEGFRDKLLHKKGNYEKGYRDRYHLDEVLKHDKFWSSHHSLDQYHKFGHQDAEFHKKQGEKYKEEDKKGGENSSSEGKKGETSGGHSGSDHKGHKTEGGSQSKYENKEEYHKKHSPG